MAMGYIHYSDGKARHGGTGDGSGNFGLAVWDMISGQQYVDTPFSSMVLRIAFSPDNKLVAIWLYHGPKQAGSNARRRADPGGARETLRNDGGPRSR